MPNIQLRIRFYLFRTQLQNECTEPKLVISLASHMKRDAMKAQRYNNLNYLQTCNTWLGSMLNEPVCIHGGPS